MAESSYTVGNSRSLHHRVSDRPRPYDPLVEDGYPDLTEAALAELPDPTPLLPAIATLVVEVIAGARSVEQMASLVSDQVYEKLRAKVHRNAKAAGDRPRLMPKFAVRNVHSESPKLGVIESVVLLSSQTRTRAVAIRLEPINRKWKATSVNVL